MRDDLEVVDLEIEYLSKVEKIIPGNILKRIKDETAHALVALEGNDVAGIISIYVDYDTNLLEILDIYTLPDKRRTHVAQTLLKETIEAVNKFMDYSLKGIVARFSDDNTNVLSFFEDLGFDIVKETDANMITYKLGDLKNSFLMSTNHSISEQYNVCRYKDMDNVTKRQLVKAITDKGGIYDTDFSDDLNEELSLAVWNGDSLVGCVEVIVEDDGSLCLGQFFSIKMDGVILAMLQKALNELLDRYEPDTNLSVYIVSESSRKLLTHLLGKDYVENSLVSAHMCLIENLEAV